MTPFVIGIAGGTGSGKSTLAFGLADAYPESVTIVHLDDKVIDVSKLSPEEVLHQVERLLPETAR